MNGEDFFFAPLAIFIFAFLSITKLILWWKQTGFVALIFLCARCCNHEQFTTRTKGFIAVRKKINGKNLWNDKRGCLTRRRISSRTKVNRDGNFDGHWIKKKFLILCNFSLNFHDQKQSIHKRHKQAQSNIIFFCTQRAFRLSCNFEIYLHIGPVRASSNQS